MKNAQAQRKTYGIGNGLHHFYNLAKLDATSIIIAVVSF